MDINQGSGVVLTCLSVQEKKTINSFLVVSFVNLHKRGRKIVGEVERESNGRTERGRHFISGGEGERKGITL
jgi:hypothetical protein